MSFDVEEWFVPLDPDPGNWNYYPSRIAQEVEFVLRLLEGHRTKATFFILTETLRKRPEIVRQIASMGHEIASHGARHRFIYLETPEELRKDLVESLPFLRKASGEGILGYRAPYFSITKDSLWALNILKNSGIRYDSSIFPVHNYRCGIPRAPRYPHKLGDSGLVEFPPSTRRIGGVNIGIGGVYFRLLPFWFIRQAVLGLNRKGHPAVLYLHPWEFDPCQPRVRRSLSLRLRHYHGLERTTSRLKALLREFRFVPMREGLKKIT